jgi:hypothetical protein
MVIPMRASKLLPVATIRPQWQLELGEVVRLISELMAVRDTKNDWLSSSSPEVFDLSNQERTLVAFIVNQFSSPSRR